MLREYDRRALRLPPDKAFSAASLGKATLKQMGIRPILERQPDFPRDVLGYSMVGFYGGRAECRIRCTPVPIVLLDYLSNYATVCCLIGAWNYFTRERIETIELDPADVQARLNELTLEELYQQPTWRDLNVLCWVEPGDENILPVRGRYDATGQSDSIAVTPVMLSEPVPWMLADLAGAKILHSDKKPAKIVRAIRIQPTGDLVPDLLRLRIPGAGMIDPRRHDYFQRLVELRAIAKTDPALDEHTRGWVRQSLKTTVNATAYGSNAEMNPRHTPKPVPVTVHGLEPFTTKTSAPEYPGEFCFPSLAAMITAGARLLLAMLEAELTQQGGGYAFGDTDSMAAVATKTGGLVPCEGGPETDELGRQCVRALSHAQIREIVAGFERLNPYNRQTIPGSILEIDEASLDQNREIRDLWAWSIAAKRYATFTWEDGRPLLAEKYSEHGLGHLADPRPLDERDQPLAADLWQQILDAELADVTNEAGWFTKPAITQRTISTPRLLRLLGGGRSADSRLRPYSFCNHAIIHPDDPAARARERFDLVAPYERDPARWADTEWVDAESGRVYRITTSRFGGLDGIRVRSIRDIVTLYRRKREAKSVAPGGTICARETVGLLQRRPVRDLHIRQIGKEANEIGEVAAGLVAAGEATTEYRHPSRRAISEIVTAAVRSFSEDEMARAANLPKRTVHGIRAGRAPGLRTLARLVDGLALLTGASSDRDSVLSACRVAQSAHGRQPECPVCGTPVGIRATYCTARCRQRAYRRRLSGQRSLASQSSVSSTARCEAASSGRNDISA